jgi:hypothetical protein
VKSQDNVLNPVGSERADKGRVQVPGPAGKLCTEIKGGRDKNRDAAGNKAGSNSSKASRRRQARRSKGCDIFLRGGLGYYAGAVRPGSGQDMRVRGCEQR